MAGRGRSYRTPKAIIILNENHATKMHGTHTYKQQVQTANKTTIVIIPQIVVSHLSDGKSVFKRCDGTTFFKNNKVPDLFKSSLRVMISLERLH